MAVNHQTDSEQRHTTYDPHQRTYRVEGRCYERLASPRASATRLVYGISDRQSRGIIRRAVYASALV